MIDRWRGIDGRQRWCMLGRTNAVAFKEFDMMKHTKAWSIVVQHDNFARVAGDWYHFLANLLD
jgi:hypothetical protein